MVDVEVLEHVSEPPIAMPNLTMEEVERIIFAAKRWMAAGEDGLPAAVWREVWPVVK